MVKKSRWLSFLLVLALVFTLVACGDTDDSTTTTTTEGGGDTTTTEGGGEIGGEIVFWDMVWGPADTYPVVGEELVEQFNQENGQGITATYQSTPWDNFYQTFLTAVTSGAAPDVSTGAFPQPVQYAIMGEMLDLTPVIQEWEAENNPILQDYSPGALDLHRWDGKQVGIPWNSDPRQITYRTDYFEQAGITSDPQTWDEFLEVCATLKETFPDKVPFAFAAADQQMTQSMLFFMFQNDVGMTTTDGTTADLTNPRAIETLEFLNTLYAEGYISEGTVSYVGADAERMYLSGETVMYLAGPIDTKDYPEVDANSGILAPMAGPNGIAQNFTWLNAIMAYQQTESPEASLAFLKWWAENNLPLWTEGGQGSFPARLSYLEAPIFQEHWAKSAIAEKVMPTAVPPTYPAEFLYPAFSQIEGENYPGRALQAAISTPADEFDAEAVAAEWNDRIQQAIDDYAE